MMFRPIVCSLVLLVVICAGIDAPALEPIPDQLVVLTFDDSVASHHAVVRPILKRYGFGATFFITEGFSFRMNKQDYMTWEQIKELHEDGFEIGNHTRDHMSVTTRTLGQLREQVKAINARCAEHGIPKPVSFGYPGNAITPEAIPILKDLGIRLARRGGAPEHPYEWGRGFAYEPGADHPLLIPSAGDARPDWTLDDFKRAVSEARAGRIAVLQFHGVPDREHPWVHTRPERFEEFMGYLHTNSFKVIALRDLARYVDPEQVPENPLAIVEKREGNLAGALEHAQKAATLNPTEPRNFTTIGEIYEAQSEFSKAVEAYSTALTLEPNEAIESKLDDLRARAAFAAMPQEYRSIETSPTVTRATSRLTSRGGSTSPGMGGRVQATRSRSSVGS